MQMEVALTLPRQPVSVPLARHLLGSILERTGVTASIIHDVKLALTEACTNAYQHVEAGETYEVHITLDDESLAIAVIDTGSGFDPLPPQTFDGKSRPLDTIGESGRGVDLIRAVTDHVAFDTVSSEGGVVRLRKRVTWADESPWFIPNLDTST
jgi:serine/threonine-protein kinase RsbW